MVSFSVNISALISIVLEPYMPEVSETLRRQLNVADKPRWSLPENFVCLLKPGHKIGQVKESGIM